MTDHSTLRDEDDFSHYFNATVRLSAEATSLRAENERLRGILDGCDDDAIERTARALCKRWWSETRWEDWPARSQTKFKEHALDALRAAGESPDASDEEGQHHG